MGREAVDDALANLLGEDGIGGYTFFFDKFLDLEQRCQPMLSLLLNGMTHNVQRFLSPLAHERPGDDWDLVASSGLLSLASNEELLGRFDLVRDRHGG